MTKEELKKEAEEWIKNHSGLTGSYMFVKYDYDSIQKAYVASAEPREKHIERSSKEIDDLENTKATLESRIAELEAQIKKMKCCENCAFFKDKKYQICHDIKKQGSKKCAFYKMI